MSDEFQLLETTVGGVSVIAVAGQADLHTAPQLRSVIAATLDDGAHRLVIDLTETTFLDSMTLGVLLGALKRLGPDGGRLAIACPDPNLRRVFEITSLDQVLDVAETTAEAIALADDRPGREP